MLGPAAQIVAQTICAAFQCKEEASVKGPTGWRTGVIRTLTKASGDPDIDVADWLDGNTPLGINKEIPYRGVFPKSDATQAVRESLMFYEARKGDGGIVLSNYKSFSENAGNAMTELDRLLKEKHLRFLGEWKVATDEWEDAIATKLAVIVKERADKTVKTRFVVDMLRSGVNGLIRVYERIVLPRGSDLVDSVVDLWEMSRKGADIELFVIDIVDALLNLRVVHEEQGHIIVTDGEGNYYVCEGAPFGLTSAPLLWGRVAAWMGRVAQAIARPWELRSQIYVDDPVMAACGTKVQRDLIFARTLQLWTACGAKLAWEKALLGKSVRWIGAQYTVEKFRITASIDADRMKKLLEKTTTMFKLRAR